MKNFSKIIVTERLVLRQFMADDYKDMFNNYASREIVTKYLSWEPHKSFDETMAYINNIVLPEYAEEYNYRWAIVLKETNQVIGSIHVVNKNLRRKCAELGYVLGDQFWGRGIIPEAGKAVINYLFEEGFVRVYALHNIENIKSGRAMQKMGMTHEGTLKKSAMDKNGNLVDCEIYAIVK